jgi:hypothetical protein
MRRDEEFHELSDDFRHNKVLGPRPNAESKVRVHKEKRKNLQRIRNVALIRILARPQQGKKRTKTAFGQSFKK